MTQPLKVKEQQKDLTVRSFIEMLVAKTAEIFYSAFKRKIHTLTKEQSDQPSRTFIPFHLQRSCISS